MRCWVVGPVGEPGEDFKGGGFGGGEWEWEWDGTGGLVGGLGVIFERWCSGWVRSEVRGKKGWELEEG